MQSTLTPLPPVCVQNMLHPKHELSNFPERHPSATEPPDPEELRDHLVRRRPAQQLRRHLPRPSISGSSKKRKLNPFFPCSLLNSFLRVLVERPGLNGRQAKISRGLEPAQCQHPGPVGELCQDLVPTCIGGER